MAVLTPNIVSSAIFGVRNYDKGNNGHGIRYAVAAGQAKKVVDYITQLDNAYGKAANVAMDALGAASKNSIFLDTCGKVATFSSSHINPLIVASAVYDVANSDNKTETAIVSATSLGAMFTGEKLAKKGLKKVPKLKGFQKVAKCIEKATKKTKWGKFIAPVASGVAFVGASIASYSIGETIGNAIVGKNEKSCLKTNDNKLVC